MSTKKLITIVVVVSFVLVAIVGIASYLIVESKSTVDLGDIETTEQPADEVVDLTQPTDEYFEDEQLEDIDETGIQPADQVQAISGGKAYTANMALPGYDHTTGNVYGIAPEIGHIRRLQEEDEGYVELSEHMELLDVEKVDWYFNKDSKRVLIQDAVDGFVVRILPEDSEAISDIFAEGFIVGTYENAFFIDATTLLALKEVEEDDETIFKIVEINIEDNEANEISETVIPGSPVQVFLHGGDTEYALFEITNDDGRSLQRMKLGSKDVEPILENTSRVYTSPTRNRFIVQQIQSNATFTNLVDLEGTTNRIVLPGDSGDIYAWNADATVIYTLVGISVADDTNTEATEEAFSAEELWQIEFASGNKNRISVFGDAVVAGLFHFDPTRTKLVAYNTYDETLTVLSGSDTPGTE